MSVITRRKVMTAIAAAPACAALPLATVPAKAGVYTPFEFPEYARTLWRRYIEAMVAHGDIQTKAEEAENEATFDISELERPWLVRGPHADFTPSRDSAGNVYRLTRTNCTGAMPNAEGNWTVLEYQPFSTRFPDRDYLGQCKTRWQPYAAANTADEALALSKAQGDKEWRSFCGKVGQIKRKRRVAALGREADAAWEAAKAISIEIAKAPCDSHAMIAVKLALKQVFDWPILLDLDDDARSGEIEDCALASIYRYTVAVDGFDPIAEWRNTPGV